MVKIFLESQVAAAQNSSQGLPLNSKKSTRDEAITGHDLNCRDLLWWSRGGASLKLSHPTLLKAEEVRHKDLT